ncbi:MAG: Leukotoxin [Verrucomicrobiota bacterium]
MKQSHLLQRGRLAVLTVLFALSLNSSHAQVLLGGGNYSQNFDTLAVTTGAAPGLIPWTNNVNLLGWFASHTGGTLTGNSITNMRAGIGDANSGSLYSFGATNVAERALGSASSGTPGTVFYGVVLSNNTASVQTDFAISYTAEQWRNGGNATAQVNTFAYRTATSADIIDADIINSALFTAFPSLNATTPTVGATAAALDGNNAANQVSFSSVLLSGVSLSPGEALFLRWTDINDAGNDHAFGIDNLTVNFSSSVPSTPPSITNNPASRTNNAGSSATFTVVAGGSGLHFQWLKGATPLTTGGNILGADTATLTINNVLTADADNYSVTITNAAGSTNSATAVLTVIDPAMNTQPVSRTNVAGDTVSFFSSVFGTQPLTYQWYHNGVPIVGGSSSNNNSYTTTISLDVQNCLAADAGSYRLVASNASGLTTTSSVAVATIPTTPANRLARWNFNQNGLSTTAPAPSEGSGSASLLGLSGATPGSLASGSFTDPAQAAAGINNGFSTANYPTASVSNKTAGIQFNVSTVGQKDILLTWEQRHSDTASKYARLQYSADGFTATTNDAQVITMGATNNSFAFYSADLSGVTSINNNANFAFRIVNEFESTATGSGSASYVPTLATSTYGAGGTRRFDLMSVYGNTIVIAPAGQYLDIALAGTNVIVSWTNADYLLQSSVNVTGTYNYIGNGSPFQLPATNAAKMFFRLHTNDVPPGNRPAR